MGNRPVFFKSPKLEDIVEEYQSKNRTMTGKTKSKKIEKNRKKCVSRGSGAFSSLSSPKKIQKTGLDHCTTVIRACHSVVGSGHKYEYNQQIVGSSKYVVPPPSLPWFCVEGRQSGHKGWLTKFEAENPANVCLKEFGHLFTPGVHWYAGAVGSRLVHCALPGWTSSQVW